jgi:hypothetical protein
MTAVLRPAQSASTPLVELLAESAPAEPTVTPRGALARSETAAEPHPMNSIYPAPLAAALIPTPGEIEQGPWREC